VKQVTRFVRVRRYRRVAPGMIERSKAGKMKTRRVVYWWFRFVLSGRFMATFLNLRRRKAPDQTPPEA